MDEMGSFGKKVVSKPQYRNEILLLLHYTVLIPEGKQYITYIVLF